MKSRMLMSESSNEIISCRVTPTRCPNRTSFSSLLRAANRSASLSSKRLDRRISRSDSWVVWLC
jgi:hypothetical protein